VFFIGGFALPGDANPPSLAQIRLDRFVSDGTANLDKNPASAWSGSQIVDFLTDQSKVFLFAYSLNLKNLVACSPNAAEVLGVKEFSIVREGNLFLRYVHDDDRFQLVNELESAIAGKRPYRVTYRWVRPDNNELRWLHCRASRVERPEGPALEGMIVDLSHEFTGYEGKFAGPDSIASVLASFPIMVFTLDRDLRIVRINRAADGSAFNFGDNEFDQNNFQVGRSLLECFKNQDNYKHYFEVLNRILDGNLKYHRARIFIDELAYNLEILPITQGESAQGLLITVSDISEVVRTERQLAEPRKTEGLRLLAAGVAHNFNNSLQTIVGHAAAIQNHPDNKELIFNSSQAILEIVSKTSSLAHQLFAEERIKANLLTPVDLNLSVMAAVNRIDNLFSSGVKIAVAFGSPPSILARDQELIEAIEAVILNAREALNGSGTISIKTFHVSLENLEVEDLPAGSYAKLSITDSGNGISASSLTRVFDPFFSTKQDAGSSRGLGLSRTFSIIRALGGAISIESLPGSGTAVSVYLPSQDRLDRPADTESSAEAMAPEILVVDDDIMVLQTMRAILKDLGYGCVAAEDYRKALNLVKAHKSDLRLVLLDALMPGMDGLALLKKIKRISKALKVIGFSGAPSELTRPMLEAGALRILRKPVDPRVLQEAIRETLEAKEAA